MQVEGLYNLEVRLHDYTNPTSKCPGCIEVLNSEPGCCDLYGELTSCVSNQRCDTYFTYTLRPLDSTQMGNNCSVPDSANHTNQTLTSSSNQDDGPLDFNSETVLGLRNPFILHGVDNEWRVRST